MEPTAGKISQLLNTVLGSLCTVVDRQYHLRPGDRFFRYLQKGVPLRIEIGEKEFADDTVTLVRRDDSTKERVSVDSLASRVANILDDMQSGLYKRALDFRKANTFDISSLDELKAFFTKEKAGGFARAHFDGSADDEKDIKDITGGATIRCMPIDDENRGRCIYTGRENARSVIFAKAY